MPVILADESVGILKIVDTEPTNTYDGDINEVNKALKVCVFSLYIYIIHLHVYSHINLLFHSCTVCRFRVFQHIGYSKRDAYHP